MMRHVALFACMVVSYSTSIAQNSFDTLFNHYTLDHPVLKKIDIHVTKDKSEKKKPLIVYLDGSGNYPLFSKMKQGYSSSVPFRVRKHSKDFYIALISKPGVPFSDSMKIEPSGRRSYPETNDFHSRNSLDWRSKAASETIDFLVKKLPIDTDKIIVMGYSEGSQVAPAVAVLNKKVTHVVCMVGNSLNQLYDFLLDARLKVARNEITAEAGQVVIDSLYRVYEKIYNDPESVNKFFYGFAYLRWSSFSKTTPLENMMKLNIPILYIAGGKDTNQTILDMDYAKLEFLRKGKTNLTYKVFPNSNHMFQEQLEIDGQIKNADRIEEVHQLALDWVRGKP